MRRLRPLFALAAVLLAPAFTRADPIGLVTLGDSLTASYTGMPYAGTNSSWTDILSAHRPGQVGITNLAVPGYTSGMMLATQPAAAVAVVQAGGANYVTLAVGANDVLAYMNQLDATNPATFDPTPHAAALVGNVATAVATLKASGAKVILSNVPDITDTPYAKAALAGQPQVAGLIQMMTDAVNAQLATIAAGQHIPLVDLDKLNAIGNGPFLLGGVDISGGLYSVDGFHPRRSGRR